ncbi:hypothetical protein ACRALDRAFT_2018737 [Sodiomyces alcalophilus JCM 7366]|uniref:uncharacterized protein n=1 Tax=Sodiomyces alcalophilus JCM 7366 TaxID=591952 RepID=UPI0039B55E4D
MLITRVLVPNRPDQPRIGSISLDPICFLHLSCSMARLCTITSFLQRRPSSDAAEFDVARKAFCLVSASNSTDSHAAETRCLKLVPIKFVPGIKGQLSHYVLRPVTTSPVMFASRRDVADFFLDYRPRIPMVPMSLLDFLRLSDVWAAWCSCLLALLHYNSLSSFAASRDEGYIHTERLRPRQRQRQGQRQRHPTIAGRLASVSTATEMDR